MKKRFPSILPPMAALDASNKARIRSEQLWIGTGVTAASTLMLCFMAYHAAGILINTITIGSVSLVAIGTAVMLAYHGWMLKCLRQNVHARQIIQSVDSGKPCDPKVADALTIVGISLVTAVERYDAIVRRWRAYEDGVTDEFNLVDRLSDEDNIRDAIISAGEDLEVYAQGVAKLYKRQSLIRELSSSMNTDTLPSFSDALENLRSADARLRNAFVVHDDEPVINPERLLAEPLLMAKLDALDKDLARIPQQAKISNG